MMLRSSRSKPVVVAAVFALAFLCAAVIAQSAVASSSTPGVGWEVTAATYPTTLPPGGSGIVKIDPFNIGAASSTGAVTVTDTLPPGLSATDAGELVGQTLGGAKPVIGHSLWNCTGSAVVTCVNIGLASSFAGGGSDPTLSFGPNYAPEIAIAVKVLPGALEAPGQEVNRVTIAGGGAPTPASTSDPVTVSSSPGEFRIASWDAWFSNADGTIDTQAGSHPYEATFNVELANMLNPPGKSSGYVLAGGGEARDFEVKLPPGLVGDPNAVPQCTRKQLDTAVLLGGEEKGLCPPASQIGTLTIVLIHGLQVRFPLFNMVAPAGIPAEFASSILGKNTFFENYVRTGSDYGITTRIDNAPEQAIIGTLVTIWGVPGDPSHDRWRPDAFTMGGCSEEEINRGACPPPGSIPTTPKPYLTLPTSCAGPQTFSLRVNRWQDPGTWAEANSPSHDSNGDETGFTGCEELGFGPSVATSPDTSQADTPAGLTVEVRPSLGGLSDPNGVGTADIQNTTVTLPEGLVINPGQAAGLAACQPYQDGVGTEDEPSCPLASKVGTDEIETPLLKDKLVGSVYVLQSNPPNLQLLVAASGDGVNLKLVGDVHLDEATGRLTTTFSNTPELPFTDFKLAFSGGAQAALATPTTCGTYTTSADFDSWSSPFVADFLTAASLGIETGPHGSGVAGCTGPLPFSPQMIAGSTTDQAGGFTNFSLLLQRADGQQRVQGLQFKTPEGLLGMISKVPLCGEPQAQQGLCPAASQIGHTVVASGPGPYPLVVPQPGQAPAPIYLTGPYRGAPYGLSIVVPLAVGPFVLDTQKVRARIEVDRLTSQLTITTDPLPQIVDGVPTDLRTINAVIDRPGFMFNPTSCEPMSFSGTAFSAQGASAPLSSHFQMGSCQSLKFKPDFRVSTAGKTSRKNGASLDVKLVYPPTPLGANQASSQSNVKSVKVDLPKQLPSRLTTLQKACTAATFETNPGACPAASRVGRVTAVTPVLPVTLTGPAYFVSYGGAKFPELVFVLQGYGVTVDVHAETFISKAGITSSTLRRVPDVPISSFELTLPQGPFSALAANGNLCQSTLKMPTAFTAQNGAVIHQSTPISVTGCPKHKKPKKAKKGRH